MKVIGLNRTLYGVFQSNVENNRWDMVGIPVYNLFLPIDPEFPKLANSRRTCHFRSTGSFRKNEKLYMLITKGWGALKQVAKFY